MTEPDADTLARHADQLAPMLAHLVRQHDQLDHRDYAGRVAGCGAIDGTTARRAESAPPGRLVPGRASRYERAFEATRDLQQRWRILRDLGDDLARRRATRRRVGTTVHSGSRVKQGRVLATASEASGLTSRELRATVGKGRQPHPALVTAALAALDGGANIAKVAAEAGTCPRTLRRWREADSGG